MEHFLRDAECYFCVISVSSCDGLIPDRQTQQLCKRLEKKIDNLSKLGGHLEKENKGIYYINYHIQCSPHVA